jgi:hypothetical protein
MSYDAEYSKFRDKIIVLGLRTKIQALGQGQKSYSKNNYTFQFPGYRQAVAIRIQKAFLFTNILLF